MNALARVYFGKRYMVLAAMITDQNLLENAKDALVLKEFNRTETL